MPAKKRTDPEVVVVTGASAGVGRAVAHAFARRGARLGLIARGRSALEATCEEVAALGGQAIPLPADVADPAQVDDAARIAEERLGPIDVWVNDAMATVFAEFLDTEPDEYRRATEVTYLGCVHGTRAALRRMVPRDRGTVVQVGSALAYRAIPLQAPYCGAKFAIRGFTDSVRTELLHRRSRVWLTMVQLPAVNTPQFSWCRSRLEDHPQPVPPIYQPEVPAEAIVRAAHQRRREVWVGGSTIRAIVGNRIAPGFADRYLARNGFRAQQDEDRRVGPREGNLFAPVEGRAATHGIFDDRARGHSVQTWATTHRSLLVNIGLGMVAASIALTGAVRLARP